VNRDRAAADALRERFAVNEFQNDSADPICLLQSVDGGDIRMIKRRQEFRLAAQAVEQIGIGRQMRRQDLERDVTTEFRIVRAIGQTVNHYRIDALVGSGGMAEV
jgi:hypothetical protein